MGTREALVVPWLELILRGLDTLIWPLTVLFLAWMFRAPLARLIERMVHAKGPGGTELTFEQDPLLVEGKSPPEVNQVEQLKSEPEKVAKEGEEALSKAKSQAEKLQALEQEAARLRDLFKRCSADYKKLAQYTENLEFDYLRRTYAIPTKQLLSWIAQQGTTTLLAAAERASQLGIRPQNLQTTFNALTQFAVIAPDGEKLSITDKGKRALAYMRQHAGTWERMVGF